MFSEHQITKLIIVHNGSYMFRWGFQPISRYNKEMKVADLHPHSTEN